MNKQKRQRPRGRSPSIWYHPASARRSWDALTHLPSFTRKPEAVHHGRPLIMYLREMPFQATEGERAPEITSPGTQQGKEDGRHGCLTGMEEPACASQASSATDTTPARQTHKRFSLTSLLVCHPQFRSSPLWLPMETSGPAGSPYTQRLTPPHPSHELNRPSALLSVSTRLAEQSLFL